MAFWTRKKRRILLATLAVVPLGLLAAIIFAPPGTPFSIHWSTRILLYQTFGPWTIVEVPLPEGFGKLKFYRKFFGPFRGEFHRRVEIRLGRGHRIIGSKIMVNGGGTMLFLHWQSADATGGPYLWLHERSGVTFVNLGKGCLGDSFKPTYAIWEWIQCRETDYPVSYNWRYFGRITYTDQGLGFLAEETWPPDVESKDVIASKRITLPGTDWIFQVDHRPEPRGSGHPRYWLTLTNPEGARITTWFKDDYPMSWGSRPGTAALFWYPATESGGPYLRVGNFDGYGFDASTLIDLTARRAYRAFRTNGLATNHGIEGRVVTGMAPIEDLWTDYAAYYPPADHFLLNPYGDDKRRLPPLPDGVRDVTAEAIGTIDLDKMTFSPEVITPVYFE